MLSIDRAGVRQRALAALDALGPETPVVRRAPRPDHRLSAGRPARAGSPRRSARCWRESPAERAWARVVASELEPIASSPLPEIPADAGRRLLARRHRAPAARATGASGPRAPLRATRPRASARRRRPRARSERPARARPSSRVGGGIVLARLGGLVADRRGGRPDRAAVRRWRPRPAAHAPNTWPRAPRPRPTAVERTATGAQVLAQVNLNPPGRRLGPRASQCSSGSADGSASRSVPPGWPRTPRTLPTPTPSGSTTRPPTATSWGSLTRASAATASSRPPVACPPTPPTTQKLLITLETQSNPKTPGTIVLEGALTGLS